MKQTMLSLAAAALLAGSSAIALAQTNNMGTNSNMDTHSNMSTPSSQLGAETQPQNGNGTTGAMSNGMSNGGAHRMAMSSSQVKQIQSALDQKGEHVTVDGKWGKQTAQAVRKFQKQNGLRATGHVDQKTMEKLGVSG